MKKQLLIILAVIGAYTTSIAQSEIGQIVVGGSVGFSSQKTKTKTDGTSTESDPNVYFNLSPRVGYYLAEDIELGLTVSYDREAYGPSDGRTIITSISFAPYARKYFELSESLFAYGQGAIGIGSGKIKTEAGGTTTKTDTYSSFSIGVSPGLMYRVGDRIGLELSAGFFGYRSYTDKNNGAADEIKTNNFGLDIDLRNINLGVTIFL